MTPKASEELWAVVAPDGRVVWTRGGSSTTRRLMVYATREKALAAMSNIWTRQVHDPKNMRLVQVYHYKTM